MPVGHRAVAALLLKICAAGLAALALAPTHAAVGDPAQCLGGQETPALTVEHCTEALGATGLSDDKRAACFTRRALAWMAQGRIDVAGADIDAAIRLDGNSSWAYNGRAVLSMQKGQVDQAIADYGRAVQLKPGYAFAWANLGNARLIKGDPERALQDLDEAVRLAPPRIELAFTARGKAWLAKGDCEHALADFDAALKANVSYANAFSGRGFARFCQGAFDAAAADFALERKIRQDAESAVDLIIATRRGGHDGKAQLAEVLKGFAADKGLPPGLALFAGILTPEQTLQAGLDRDPNAQRQRMCAADFQVGEWYLLQPDQERARQYLRKAREACDQSQPEFGAAGAELARLK
jgi:tetratricopeptide (TPR) repeat protein